MTDLETRIRDDLTRRAEAVHPSSALDARVERVLAEPAAHRRSPLLFAAAASVLVALLVAGTLVVVNLDRDGGEDVVTTDPPTTEASWRELPPPPLDPNAGFSAVVATDDEVIVFGSAPPGEEPVGGAALNLESDTWRTIAPVPLSDQVVRSAAWTGDEVALLGGEALPGSSAGPVRNSVLLAYDPSADEWRALADLPEQIAVLIPRSLLSLHWTGTRLAVASEGGLLWTYEPGTDRWQEVSGTSGLSMTFVDDTVFRSNWSTEPVPGARPAETMIVQHRIDRFDLETGEETSVPSPLEPDLIPLDPENRAQRGVDAESAVLVAGERLVIRDDTLLLFAGDQAWAKPVDGGDWRSLPEPPDWGSSLVPPLAAGSHLVILGGEDATARRPLDTVRFWEPISGRTTEATGFDVGGRGLDAVVWTGEEAVLVHQNVIMRPEWTVLAFTPG